MAVADKYTDEELLALQQALYTSRNPTRRWLHNCRRDWIREQISLHASGCRRALEVGPGSGIYLPDLAAVAEEVVAADIEEAYLAQARQLTAQLPGLRCVLDDITDTTMEPGSFDLVLCTEVIEHIADSGAALAGLAGLLAPGGRLILTTPQRYSPLEVCAKIAFLPGVIQLVRLIYREPVIETGHINLLTEGQLQAQMAAAGLAVQAQHKTGFYLPVVAEAGGNAGLGLLRWCEGKLRNTAMDWLLWTQCYVLGRAEVRSR